MIVKHINDPSREVIKSHEPTVEKVHVKTTPDKEIDNNKKGKTRK